MEAAESLAKDENGGDLDQRLKDAGIVSGGAQGSDIMERIRAKRGGNA